jgi:NAD(P)-dependent dehydrogenase (short-subunit alcohol dehydrogenase family)
MESNMPNILIVGATRGLGASLVKIYVDSGARVFATSRSKEIPESTKDVTYIPDIDVAKEDAGSKLAKHIGSIPLDVVIITAGYFGTESFDEPNWDAEVKMYTTSSIGPVFIVHALAKANLLPKGSKIILVSSESGSITLRHESEGGGNYGHHASKAALNMVGKLLSLDLKKKGVTVGIVHPGFMRTEMTKGVGFDKFWDEGGAVTPDQAAESLVKFVEGFDIKNTGEYWAPRGPG